MDLQGRPVEWTWLHDMNQAMRHRGPDDEGYVLIDRRGGEFHTFSGPESHPEIRSDHPPISSALRRPFDIGLAHRRFSIIDLSPGGHQPFFDSDRTCCVVFNGEIYNFVELRRELQDRGHVFRTSSDTETIVEAYKAWGTGCFARFAGMWALALYDFANRRLLLSRDHVGKKPLYWTRLDDRVAFASEIRALLEIPMIARAKSVNEDAVYPFLAYGLRDLANSTFFEGIFTLPAGSWATVSDDFPGNAQEYWSPPKTRLGEHDISAGEAADKVGSVLREAVRIRMRADVPWCITLSGGMDSSAIVAKAAELTDTPVTTYTLRFPEKEWNEEPHARSVASRYGTSYHVVDSPEGNLWREIEEFTHLTEEPYNAPNAYSHQAIRTVIRAYGNKMALGGAGGDEVFAGYRTYFRPSQIGSLRKLELGHYLSNGSNWTEAGRSFEGLTSPLSYLARLAWRDLRWRLGAGAGAQHGIRARVSKDPSHCYSLESALYGDMTNRKIPYWLRIGDKLQMGIPLEMRKPLLDYRVVELGFTLPLKYLIRDGWHKWILRKSLEGALPADVLWRRRKMGGPFPIVSFLRQSEDIIQTIAARSRNPYVRYSGEGDPALKWRVLSFLLWYELFFNDNHELFAAIRSLAERRPPGRDLGFVPEYRRGSAGIRSGRTGEAAGQAARLST